MPYLTATVQNKDTTLCEWREKISALYDAVGSDTAPLSRQSRERLDNLTWRTMNISMDVVPDMDVAVYRRACDAILKDFDRQEEREGTRAMLDAAMLLNQKVQWHLHHNNLSSFPDGFSTMHRYAIAAMLELGAIAKDARRTREEIVLKATGDRFTVGLFKKTMSALKRWGLVESAKGRGGGSWLTLRGREAAELIMRTV